MVNPRLVRIDDNPWARLRALLDGAPPRTNLPHILMSLGEPQHDPPPFMARIIAETAHLWNRYPPMQGTPAYRAACAAWLTRRYGLPPGMVTGERNVLSLNGTKEGLFLAAAMAVPQEKRGKVPAVLMPNPYYLVYNGAAAMAGAEAVFLDATAKTGFLPDLDAIPDATLARTALFYLCSPGNPQGAIADLAYLKKAIALARAHDFVLAMDECYCEIYDGLAPPGALEACAALGGDMSNVLVFHSLSKRSSAAGLRCGFVAGDADAHRASECAARLWRRAGAAADPGGGDRALGAMRPMSRRTARSIAASSTWPSASSRAASASTVRPAGSCCGSMSATARRRRSRCGATRRCGPCPAPISPARPRAATIRASAISASRWCMTTPRSRRASRRMVRALA